MANYTTSADLLTDIIFRAGEPSTGSDFEAAALRYLNRAYQALWTTPQIDPSIGEPWWWLRKDGRGSVILKPYKASGTVSVTNDSATATLSAVVNEDLDGWYLKADGCPDVFRVSAHTSGSAVLTLDSIFTGTTNATSSYKLFKLEYDLPTDLLALTGPMRCYREGGRPVTFMDEEQMDLEWPLQEMSFGVPEKFTMIGERRVRFSHYGNQDAGDFIRLDFSYIVQPSDLANDSTEPLVPRQYRYILCDWALGLLFLDLDDSRGPLMMNAAKIGLLAMTREQRKRTLVTDNMIAVIRPRPRQLRDGRVLRTESGHILGRP